MRLIDADKLLKKQIWAEGYGGWNDMVVTVTDINSSPTVGNGEHKGYTECFECGWIIPSVESTGWCSSCGARIKVRNEK